MGRRPRLARVRIVVTDDFDKLADRLEGTLKRPAVGFEVGEGSDILGNSPAGVANASNVQTANWPSGQNPPSNTCSTVHGHASGNVAPSSPVSATASSAASR